MNPINPLDLASFSLSWSLIGLIVLTLLVSYAISLTRLSFLISFISGLSLFGLSVFVTGDLISGLIVFLVFGLMTIRETAVSIV